MFEVAYCCYTLDYRFLLLRASRIVLISLGNVYAKEPRIAAPNQLVTVSRGCCRAPCPFDVETNRLSMRVVAVAAEKQTSRRDRCFRMLDG